MVNFNASFEQSKYKHLWKREIILLMTKHLTRSIMSVWNFGWEGAYTWLLQEIVKDSDKAKFSEAWAAFIN